ncbi:MAG: type IV toxin-antitoxin system AbiEi family antitoxin [Dysgonamonadaceae bacterium]|jgi:predicted transcriptional regulator of viral defense system|nr:type IV toxin-antitoxin system AbiEi family antitoxin [Dysgonamonadaceae bacterium]
MKNADIKNIDDWILYRYKRGNATFTRQELVANFSNLSEQTIKNNLNLLIKKGQIFPVFKGFYSVIPISYALMGIVPPEFYIDDLMKSLNRQYYVCLLNAASYYGAAHQKPQIFSVITSLPTLRDTTKRNIKINFIATRKTIPQKWLKNIRGENGDFLISKSELTAADLITFQKEIGGLNRSCTVIYELMETVKFGKLDKTFFEYVPTSTIQRLGYLLENELEQQQQADILFSKAKTHNCKFQKLPLKSNKAIENCEINDKWKIVINETIEIDDL